MIKSAISEYYPSALRKTKKWKNEVFWFIAGMTENFNIFVFGFMNHIEWSSGGYNSGSGCVKLEE